MCQYRSGVVVFNSSDGTASLKMLPGEDSHAKIRKHYHIRDDDGPGATRQTPVEYQPTKDLLDLDSYELMWDAGRPEWWTDEHTEQTVRQFRADLAPIIAARKWEWLGDLRLNDLTALPEGVTLRAKNVYYAREWHGAINQGRR